MKLLNLTYVFLITLLCLNLAYAEENASNKSSASSTTSDSQSATTTQNNKSKKNKKDLKNRRDKPSKSGDWAPRNDEIKNDPELNPTKSKYKFKGEELEVDPD